MEIPQPTAHQATALEHAFPGGTETAARERTGGAAQSSLIVPLFASTMFFSGFLLFLVEPMAAKMVLPILGGVPMVWNGCVVFFQIVMLAGYGYAFGASRWLPLRHHVVLHALVLAAPAAGPALHDPGGIGDAARAATRSRGCCCCSPAASGFPSSCSRRARRSSSIGCHARTTLRPAIRTSCIRPATSGVCSRSRRTRPSWNRCSRCASRRISGPSATPRSSCWPARAPSLPGGEPGRPAFTRRHRRPYPVNWPVRRSRRCAARAGWRSRSSRRASCSRSRAMCRPTSRRCRSCGSCRSRCTSSPSRWPSAGTRRRSGRWRGGRSRCSSCRSRSS